ncbi:MAG: alkylation response protein AidB-like acyl-CoA dehydrogenase, partial [Glaciecola sp.]
MFFDLDDDERALQSGIRELAAGRISMQRVRATDVTAGVDRALFVELAEAGVFGLTMREADGGLGLGTTHAAVVFEELGRVLAPGPLVATHLAAGGIPGAAEGTTIVGVLERARLPLAIEHLGGLDVLLVIDDSGVHKVAAAEIVGIPV